MAAQNKAKLSHRKKNLYPLGNPVTLDLLKFAIEETQFMLCGIICNGLERILVMYTISIYMFLCISNILNKRNWITVSVV